MPSDLRITEEEAKPGDVRGKAGVRAKLVAQHNALQNCEVRTDTGKNLLTIGNGKAMLEVDASGAGGGDLLWWNVVSNGVAAYAQFVSTASVTTLPDGATTEGG